MHPVQSVRGCLPLNQRGDFIRSPAGQPADLDGRGDIRKFQARAAEELALLPERSVIAEMLADYAVMREQARSC